MYSYIKSAIVHAFSLSKQSGEPIRRVHSPYRRRCQFDGARGAPGRDEAAPHHRLRSRPARGSQRSHRGAHCLHAGACLHASFVRQPPHAPRRLHETD